MLPGARPLVGGTLPLRSFVWGFYSFLSICYENTHTGCFDSTKHVVDKLLFLLKYYQLLTEMNS